MGIVKNFKMLPSKTRALLSFGILLAIVVALPLFVWMLRNMNLNLKEKAQYSPHNATVRFSPTTLSINSNTEFEIWIDTNNSIGFADIKINFDKNLINLSQNVSYAQNLQLDQDILTTQADDANSTGEIQLIRAITPQNSANAPSGSIKFATLTFEPKTSNTDITTSVNILDSSQIVAMDQSVFTLTMENLSLVINPSQTPTPSPTGTSSPTATTTPTTSASPTPTPEGLVGDVNDDGKINVVDIGIVIEHYGKSADSYIRADLNGDGVINIVDLGVVIDNYNI